MLKMHHMQNLKMLEIMYMKRSKGEMNMAVISYIDAVTMAIREEMERDEKVFVLEKMSG